MDDKLKKYIDKNRADFDNKEPSAELWKRIQTNIPQQPKVLVPQKKWNIGYWSIAASALILVSIGLYFMQNDHSVSVTKEQIVVKQKTEKVKQKEQINSVLEKLENKKSNQIEVVTHNKKIEINFFILLFYKKFSDSVWFYLSKACELSFRKKFTTLRLPIHSCFVS